MLFNYYFNLGVRLVKRTSNTTIAVSCSFRPMFYTTSGGCMWTTVMYNLRVVNAVHGNSGVSYGEGYLAQTRLKVDSATVLGGIAVQLLASPSCVKTVPPAIGSE